jgi:hypothetical protein
LFEIFRPRVPCLQDPIVCLGDAGTLALGIVWAATCADAICFACSCKGRETEEERTTVLSSACELLLMIPRYCTA